MAMKIQGFLVFLLVVAGVVYADDPMPINLPDTPPTISVNVSNSTDVCIIMAAGIRFTVQYKVNEKNVTGEFDLPTNSTFQGNCGNDTTPQTLTISFLSSWKLSYTFTRDVELKHWYATLIELAYTLEKGEYPFPDFPHNVSGTAVIKNLTEYQTQVNSSYQCRAMQALNFTEDSGKGYVLGFGTYNLQVQAYHYDNTTTFDSAIGCPADQVSNIVPIAVGAALGALVIIVLIAYFIGRSRNKRGYESV